MRFAFPFPSAFHGVFQSLFAIAMLHRACYRKLFSVLLMLSLPIMAEKNTDDVLCLTGAEPTITSYPHEKLPCDKSFISHSLAIVEGVWLDFWAYSQYLLTHCREYIFPDTDYSSLDDVLDSGHNASALFVLLQALHHPPCMWNQYIEALASRMEIDLWVPDLPRWGNTASGKVLPILEKPLRKYLSKWPDRPIVLVGSSNGARIGLELEIKLRNQRSTIILVSLAGVFAGTERLWMRRIITDSDFYRECSYKSGHNLDTVRMARHRLSPEAIRKHLFYIADGDFFIVPLNASLLTMGHDEEFYYVMGAGHISIVDKMRDEVLEKAFQWIQQQESAL